MHVPSFACLLLAVAVSAPACSRPAPPAPKTAPVAASEATAPRARFELSTAETARDVLIAVRDARGARRAIHDARLWTRAEEAPAIAAAIAGAGAEEEQKALAEMILSGEVDAAPRALEAHFLAAAFDPDPERQLRAIPRMDAAAERGADALAALAGARTYRADVRYEALKALAYAGRAGLIPDSTQAAIHRDYEALIERRP